MATSANAIELPQEDVSEPVVPQAPSQGEGVSAPPDPSESSLGIFASGILIALRIKNDPNRFTVERLEKEARKFGLKYATEAAKKQAKLEGRKYSKNEPTPIRPYEQAKQGYYNYYVRNYRDTAKIFKTNPRQSLNANLQKAFTVDDARLEVEKTKKRALEAEAARRKAEEDRRKQNQSQPADYVRRRITNKITDKITNRIVKRFTKGEATPTSAARQPGLARRFIQKPVGRLARPAGRVVGQAASKTAQAGQQAAEQIGKQAARIGAQVGKLGAQAMTKLAPLLLNPYVLAVILIIVLIVIIFALFMAILNGQNGAGGEFGVQPPAQGQTLTCPSGDYATCLVIDFHVSVGGVLPSDGLKVIFSILANAASSPAYQSLLVCNSNSNIPIVVTTGGGASTSYSTIILNGFFTGGKTLGSQTNLLIHELGHQIYNRNCGRVKQKYSYSTLVSQDSTCYDSGYLISYALRSPYRACDGVYTVNDINGLGESFAESLADYVSYKSYAGYPNFLCSVSLKNTYKSTCPNTYDWVKTNIFGGVEF